MPHQPNFDHLHWAGLPGDGATVTRYLPALPHVMQAIAAGDWTVVEHRLPPYFGGPRPHSHAQIDVIFYVLEGQPTFQLGEQTYRAEAGQWVVASRGTVHTVFNSQAEPARILAFCLPGGAGEALVELTGATVGQLERAQCQRIGAC